MQKIPSAVIPCMCGKDFKIFVEYHPKLKQGKQYYGVCGNCFIGDFFGSLSDVICDMIFTNMMYNKELNRRKKAIDLFNNMQGPI